MNAKTILSRSLFSNLSLAAVAATLSLSVIGCGAAPDGDPSLEPAKTSTNGDLVDDAGSSGDASNSLWIPAMPDQPDPTPFLGGTGGTGGSGSGSGSGGGDRPRPQRRQ